MSYLTEVEKLLNLKDAQIEALSIEKLRILLRTLRQHSRRLEREINIRTQDFPFGNIIEKN